MLQGFFELFVGKGNVTEHFVRKLAHFTEFFVLGLELAVLFCSFSSKPILFSLLVALTDETIQLFTGRGSQVKDVWLDFFGACTGYFMGMVALRLIQKRLDKRKNNSATVSET